MKTDIKVKNWQLRKVKCTDASVDLSQKEFVAVEKRAFSNRGNRKYTEQVILPKGVSVLKAEAFSACTRLKQITLPADNNVGISGGVFQNCCRLRTVNNSGVIQSIGARAFLHCDMLQEIELGSDLRRIGEEAFRGCRSLRRIDLPPSLREIGKGAFRDCTELEFFSASEDLPQLAPELFRDCISLREVTLSKAVQVVPSRAFEGCSALREVAIPSNVQTIETRAFADCRRLKKVTMELGVQRIGAKAFLGAEQLQEVVVPHTLKKLGRGAFGLGKRKDGEKITVCVENEYMVRRMKRLLFWCGSGGCTTVKLVGKSIEERKRERRRSDLNAKGAHLV